MSENRRSFWSSVPGFVTGMAGLLTAIVGLVTVLIQLDVIGGDESNDAPSVATTVAGGSTATTTEAPAFLVSPTMVDFAGAREKTVQVRNTGSTPLKLSRPTFEGKDAAQFSASLERCAEPLAPRLSCDIKVTFTPSGPLRSYEARLQLTAGAAAEEVSLKASTIL